MLYKQIKDAVYVQDHVRLKEIYMENASKFDLSDLFIKSLNHACTYQRKSTIIFLLQSYYDVFSDIEKIALRQCFQYGKFLLKDKEMIDWYNMFVLPLVIN